MKTWGRVTPLPALIVCCLLVVKLFSQHSLLGSNTSNHREGALMKVYKFVPILAVALLIPSFAAAEHSDRGGRRQYSDRDHDRHAPDRATYGRRAGYDRGHDRGYDRGHHRKTSYGRRQHRRHDDHYYDHHGHNRSGHSRQGSHRRGRRGIHFGGVIVIRF